MVLSASTIHAHTAPHRVWLLLCNALKLERQKLMAMPAAGGSNTGPAAARNSGGTKPKGLRDPTAAEEVKLIREETGTFVCAMTGVNAPRKERVQVCTVRRGFWLDT